MEESCCSEVALSRGRLAQTWCTPESRSRVQRAQRTDGMARSPWHDFRETIALCTSVCTLLVWFHAMTNPDFLFGIPSCIGVVCRSVGDGFDRGKKSMQRAAGLKLSAGRAKWGLQAPAPNPHSCPTHVSRTWRCPTFSSLRKPERPQQSTHPRNCRQEKQFEVKQRHFLRFVSRFPFHTIAILLTHTTPSRSGSTSFFSFQHHSAAAAVFPFFPISSIQLSTGRAERNIAFGQPHPPR